MIITNSAGYFGSMRILLISQLLTCIVIIGFVENQSVELNSIQTLYCDQQCMLKAHGLCRASLLIPTGFACCVFAFKLYGG